LWKTEVATVEEKLSKTQVINEFQAAINQCLDELFDTHAEELMPLLNPKFRTYKNASILAV
jgi:hypothetical protein